MNLKLYNKIIRSISKEVKRSLLEDASQIDLERWYKYAKNKEAARVNDLIKSRYKNSNILAELKKRAMVSDLMAQRVNEHTVRKTRGKLMNLINRYKNGFKISDDVTLTPIFVLEEGSTDSYRQNRYVDMGHNTITLYVYILDYRELTLAALRELDNTDKTEKIRDKIISNFKTFDYEKERLIAKLDTDLELISRPNTTIAKGEYKGYLKYVFRAPLSMYGRSDRDNELFKMYKRELEKEPENIKTKRIDAPGEYRRSRQL